MDIHYKTGDEIAHPFQNFNGTTVEVMECISNFIPYFTDIWLRIYAGIKVNPC